MILGISQLDITPKPGVELSGFAARLQPSTGILDPLYAKALLLVCGESKLLWIHCDLIGFDPAIVRNFRQWAQQKLGLKENQVMLSATHTHSGPCTIHLREAGEYDENYVAFLMQRLCQVAEAAVAKTERVEVVTVEAELDLAIDRRRTASSHTDPRVAGVGFKKASGEFSAVIVNYPVHPVALGPTNRLISADMFGCAASALSAKLAGKPVVLVTNGACANLNPPAENVSPEQVEKWGWSIADAVVDLLSGAKSAPKTELQVISKTVRLPLDTLDAEGINQVADRALHNPRPLAEWGDKYRRVVEHWRSNLLKDHDKHFDLHNQAELFGVRINGVVLIGANAEVFSEFTDMLRRHSELKIYLIGYANGDMGYLPTRTAYIEGGYEVDVAHMFYGGFRAKAGGLELLASAGAELVAEFKVPFNNSASNHGKATRQLASTSATSAHP